MKNDYFKQKLKALTANKEFKRAVSNFRKEWKLPADGVAINENAIKDWIFDVIVERKNTDSIAGFPVWLGIKKRIKQYVSLVGKGLFEGEQEKAFELESSLFPSDKKFNQKIKDILTKFSLPYSYLEYLKRYLIINDFHYISSDKIKIAFVKRPSGRVGLAFEVFQDTTGEDIIARLDEIKKAQDEFFGPISGRKRSKDYFERDLMIYELREQGAEAKQIAEIIQTNRSKRREELRQMGLQEDIIQRKLNDEFGKILGYNDIYKIAERFKKTYFGKK